jgi:hypothetical protein
MRCLNTGICGLNSEKKIPGPWHGQMIAAFELEADNRISMRRGACVVEAQEQA